VIYLTELYGLAVGVALTMTALIILSVVLVIVVIKYQRRRKGQRVSQGETNCHRSCQEAKSLFSYSHHLTLSNVARCMLGN
jgi:uncharacterized membrane protein